MKIVAAITLLAAFALAEPPPSHSYLPPSSRSQGYPRGPSGLAGAPEVVAARTLGAQGHGPNPGVENGFARNGQHGHNPKGKYPGNGEQGYDLNAGALGRNALDEINSEPANYNFEYMVNDYREGTDFAHHEERQDERALGEYHVVLPDGRKQTVSYEADERGFKPRISYEDTEGDALGRSGGYDANANNVHGKDGNGFANGGRSNNGARNGY